MKRAARGFLCLFPVVAASGGLSLFGTSGAKLSSAAATSDALVAFVRRLRR